MVTGKYCCVPRCKSRYKFGSGISFHSMPLSRKCITEQWLRNIQREKSFVPGKYTYVCSLHFEDSDYECGGVRRRLKKDAIPTVFQGTPRPPLKKKTVRVVIEDVVREVTDSTVATERSFVTTSPESCEWKCQEAEESLWMVKQQMRFTKLDLSRRKRVTAGLQAVFEDLEEKRLLTESVKATLDTHLGHLPDLTRELFNNELKNCQAPENGPAFSDKIILFALNVRYESPQAYEYLRTLFHLPCPKTLCNWTTRALNPPQRDAKNDVSIEDV